MRKNFLIIGLSGMLLISISFAYKYYNLNIFSIFPLDSKTAHPSESPPLYLFLYFHSHDCPQCLKIIETLNNLPPHFIIKGIVPKDEIKDKEIIKKRLGANFDIEPATKYKKFVPLISPCLIGVTKSKAVIFIIPALPEQDKYLLDFLESTYYNRILVGF
jgi:hypothetical protein